MGDVETGVGRGVIGVGERLVDGLGADVKVSLSVVFGVGLVEVVGGVFEGGVVVCVGVLAAGVSVGTGDEVGVSDGIGVSRGLFCW